jgi:hypothetical protein
VEKVFLVCRVLDSEYLIVLVHDIFDREKKMIFPDMSPDMSGDMSGKILNPDMSSGKILNPDISGSTSTDEGETIEVSVVVVS